MVYLREKLSSPEIREIERQVAKASPEDRPLVRWMRDKSPDRIGPTILVFIEVPAYDSHGGYQTWDVLNSNNITIDSRECWIHPYPKA
jgi:hypothetical protein